MHKWGRAGKEGLVFPAPWGSHFLGYLHWLQMTTANNYWQFQLIFLTFPTLWFCSFPLATTGDAWHLVAQATSPWSSESHHPYPTKPWDWTTFSALGRTEPDSPMTPWSISSIVTYASLYNPALFPSQFPSYQVERQYFLFLSLSLAPIAGPITSAQLLFQVSTAYLVQQFLEPR